MSVSKACNDKPAASAMIASPAVSRPVAAARSFLSLATALGITFTAAVALSGPVSAAPVFWTNWQSSTSTSASGQMTVGASTVAVDYSGTSPHLFVTTTGGTNYWAPSAPYISATVDNAPPASDIVALNAGGTVTITFSEAVTDPFIGLVSWNNNTVDFGVPIEIVSFGLGHFGSGTPTLNAGGTGFFGSGEVHGVIRLPGTHTSITFTHTSEAWHGFTVGVAGVAAAVPEPASLALCAIGLLGFGLRRGRRRLAVSG